MEDQIRILTVKQACDRLQKAGLKTTPLKLGIGLQQKVYPFGVAIKMSEWCYEIYSKLLEDWIAERAG